MKDAARFAGKGSTPVDRDKARAIAEQSAQLARFIEDLCLTNDTLWDENGRLQEGVDKQMEIVADLRGQLAKAKVRRRGRAGELAAFSGVSIDAVLIDRLRKALVGAHNRRFLVANVELEDMEALMTMLDQFTALLAPKDATR